MMTLARVQNLHKVEEAAMAQTFDTSDAPHLTIARCNGDFCVAGIDRRQVVVMGDEDKLHVERQGESFTITADDDCDLQCPLGTSVTIKQVSGDLDVQEISGPLAIEVVNGGATLRQVGPTTLRQVNGDLQVRDANGELRAESVSGDVKVRQAAGKVVLQSVRGDLSARDLEGGAAVQEVSGDISLGTVLSSGASYQFEAHGDISAKVEVGEGGARFTLEGGDLHCRLPLQVSERSGRRIVGTLGEGKSELILKAKGDLAISERGESWGPDNEAQFESAMDAWAQQFEAQMADMQRKLEERLANIPYVDAEQVTRRAQEAAERARRQAERAAERAKVRAERASRKHHHRGVGIHVSWPPSSSSSSVSSKPRPPAEPVSDSERMTILKMVADKKITADEAQRLLSALEGEA
jgi:hypothetical protein